jgi:PAS domain S-box-containing protein
MPALAVVLALGIEFIVAAALSALLVRFRRRFAQPYLRDWGLAWCSLTLAILGRLLIVATQPGAIRNLGASLTAAGSAAALGFFVSGSAKLRGGRGLDDRQARWLVGLAVAGGLTLTWISALLTPGSLPRLLIRGGAPECFVVIAGVVCGTAAWRSRAVLPGAAFLAVGFAAVAVARIGVLAILLLAVAGPIESGVFASVSTAATLLLALGVLTVMLYVESDRAVTASRDREEMAARFTGALARSEFFFKSLIDAAQDILTVTTVDGTIVFCSPAVERALGHPPATLIGRRISDFVHPDDVDAVREAFARAVTFQDGVPRPVTYRARNVDGSWVRFESRGSQLRAPDEAPRILIVSRNLTDLDRADRALGVAQTRALISEESAAFAHDFNNLLAVIRTSLELLADPVTSADDRDELLGDATSAANRAADLSRAMLAAIRAPDAPPAAVDLRAVITGNERLLRRLAGSTTTMAIELPSTPAMVVIEQGLLVQILLNLVVNARDAMPRGGELRVAVAPLHHAAHEGEYTVVPLPPNAAYEVRVTDNGVGMSDEILARAFEPYFTSKPSGRGSGLGLALCRNAAIRLPAGLRVRSAPGSGTTFRIVFAAAGD